MKFFEFVVAVIAFAMVGHGTPLANPFTLTHTINNPAPAANDQFGYSVDVSGGIAIVGAPDDRRDGDPTGIAYLVDTATGSLTHSLFPSAPLGRDRFGWSVGIDDSLAIVGAPLRNGPGTDAGWAFVFDSNTGNQVSILDNPGVGGAQFGRSVDISGNIAVAGAPFANSNDSGAAYVFDALTGNLLNTLINPLQSANDQFGFEVAIDDNLVAVSSRLENVGAGAVHVFDAFSGNLVTSIFDPTPAQNDQFGFSLDIDDGKVLVGTPFDDHLDNDTGRAFIFDALTGDLLQTLTNPNPTNGDQFGTSVDLSGGIAVVGSHLDDPSSVNSAGSAYVFDVLTGDLLQSIANPFPDNDDFFTGFNSDGLAVDGGTLVVGAVFDDNGASNAGQAYIYEAELNQEEGVPLPGAVVLLLTGMVGMFGRFRIATHLKSRTTVKVLPTTIFAGTVFILFCSTSSAAPVVYTVSTDRDPDFFAYDTSKGSWSKKADIETTTQLAVDKNGDVFAVEVGGAIKKYDAELDTWNTVLSGGGNFAGEGNLEVLNDGRFLLTRFNSSAYRLSNGHGGWTSGSFNFEASSIGDYDPFSNTLVIGERDSEAIHVVNLDDFTTTEYSNGAMATDTYDRRRSGSLLNGTFYQKWGDDNMRAVDLGSPTNPFYDLRPGNLLNPSSAADRLNNVVYFGGMGSFRFGFQIYDPSTGRYNGRPDIPSQLGWHSTMVVGGVSALADPVPAPGALALFVIGLAGLGTRRRLARKQLALFMLQNPNVRCV